MTGSWTLHPDRALPAEPATRQAARSIYQSIAGLPIVSMHGHVPVEWLAHDIPFADPAQLLVVPDHYLFRMLNSQGTAPHQLGVPTLDGSLPVETDSRTIWKRFCQAWPLFRGTPTRLWMETVLVDIFGVTQRPSADAADGIYDHIAAQLASPDFKPRALMDKFSIEILGTTDPAWASLSDHKILADMGWGQRVVPTFRPDAVCNLASPSFAADVLATGAACGIEVTSYDSYLDALRGQRLRFKAAGSLATDHGCSTANTQPLDKVDAAALFDAAMRGQEISPAQALAFEAHMLFMSAQMSSEDGLVMQIHPGVLRGYDQVNTARYGADKGYDIPYAVEYTRALRPMLEAFGHNPHFRCIVFTIDEDVYTRELAPLAGVFPSMRLGAPWWFIDSPEGMRRFRETATETAGFYNTSGFVDDTRAFCSIPARHDLARRIDAGYLGRLVAEHRLDLDEAIETAYDLTYTLPRRAYAPVD